MFSIHVITLFQVSGIWQSSLQNNQIQVQRYMVGTDRVLLQIDDGSKAWEIKDYLITLDTVAKVEIENQAFEGKGAHRTKLELQNEEIRFIIWCKEQLGQSCCIEFVQYLDLYIFIGTYLYMQAEYAIHFLSFKV